MLSPYSNISLSHITNRIPSGLLVIQKANLSNTKTIKIFFLVLGISDPKNLDQKIDFINFV